MHEVVLHFDDDTMLIATFRDADGEECAAIEYAADDMQALRIDTHAWTRDGKLPASAS